MLVLQSNLHTPFWHRNIEEKLKPPTNHKPQLSHLSIPGSTPSTHSQMSAMYYEPPLSASPGSAINSAPSAPSSMSSDDRDESSLSNHAQEQSPVSLLISEPEVLHHDSEVRSKLFSNDSHVTPPCSDHFIQLSSIEHCMPRAYIRICSAYRLPENKDLTHVEDRLNSFVRKLVDAKPYLAGYVVPVHPSIGGVGAVQIQFSDQDFLEYPKVNFRHLTKDEVPNTYDELCAKGLPPSMIKPDLVSALTESADDDRAPVFRVQANIVEGGLIVSVYLHHCISDGTGAGLLITGSVLYDDFAFDRHLPDRGFSTQSLSVRLAAFAKRKSVLRQELSWSSPNQINDRHLQYRDSGAPPLNIAKSIGRGCVISFPLAGLAQLKAELELEAPEAFLTANDALVALLWHSMTKARIPSVVKSCPSLKSSKLLIPVNIRSKLKPQLSDSYFGSAVDFASVQMSLFHLSDASPAAMLKTALEIRLAINNVDEAYIRQAIALAIEAARNPRIDVRDLQASNMNRATGADMYVTSWEKLNLYEATFELGLGQPDFIRKPWSKDPGSCIVLPYDKRKDYIEVVVQMTEADMERLLENQNFMAYVSNVID